MTRSQKHFYRAVLEMNAGFLSHGTNLANIAIELRKICLHTYLIKDAEGKILAERGTNLTIMEQLDSCKWENDFVAQAFAKATNGWTSGFDL
jgi:hypothetical protein